MICVVNPKYPVDTVFLYMTYSKSPFDTVFLYITHSKSPFDTVFLYITYSTSPFDTVFLYIAYSKSPFHTVLGSLPPPHGLCACLRCFGDLRKNTSLEFWSMYLVDLVNFHRFLVPPTTPWSMCLPAALRRPQKNTPLDFWSMYLVDFVDCCRCFYDCCRF